MTSSGRTFGDFEVGDTYRTSGRTITHADIRMWIGATDGTHPNHVDAEYVDEHPVFDDIVAPGLLTLSLADAFCAAEISRNAAYGMNYGHDAVRYLAPVYVGDTISGDLEITETEVTDETWGLLTIDVTLSNQRDEDVLFEKHKMLISRESSF